MNKYIITKIQKIVFRLITLLLAVVISFIMSVQSSSYASADEPYTTLKNTVGETRHANLLCVLFPYFKICKKK